MMTKWKIVKTNDVTLVDLGDGHTAKLRPLTPRELRAAEINAGPVEPYALTCFKKLYEVLEKEPHRGDEPIQTILSAEEITGHAKFTEWLRERSYQQLKIGALLEIDGEKITDIDELLESIRPVSAALVILDILGAKLRDLHELPIEGKEQSAPMSGGTSTAVDVDGNASNV